MTSLPSRGLEVLDDPNWNSFKNVWKEFDLNLVNEVFETHLLLRCVFEVATHLFVEPSEDSMRPVVRYSRQLQALQHQRKHFKRSIYQMLETIAVSHDRNIKQDILSTV